MENNNFTESEIANFNFYNSEVTVFDDCFDFENENYIKLNKRAANTEFEILKFSKSRKIALFKDKNKVYFTSLQGCNCKQYETSEDNCCIHMFKLAQLLGIIDIETGILLYPQKEFEEISFEEIETPSYTRQYTPPSTVGIGKHCKNCNKIIDFNKTVCPFCGQNADAIYHQDNSKSDCFIFFAIILLAIIFIGLIT